MDPTITLRTMRDPGTEPDDRVEAAHALIAWLEAGAFVPPGEDREAVFAEAGQVLTTLDLER